MVGSVMSQNSGAGITPLNSAPKLQPIIDMRKQSGKNFASKKHV